MNLCAINVNMAMFSRHPHSFEVSPQVEFPPHVVEPSLARLARRFIPRSLAVLQAGRLHNSIALASVGVIGLLSADRSFTLVLPYLLAWTTFFLGIYFFNDYFDASIDAVNKPWKPVPSGRIDANRLRTMGIWFLGVGVAFIILSLRPIGLEIGSGSIAAIISAYLGFEYSRWMKRKCPIFGDVVISITVAICFLLPWMAGGEPNPSYLLSLPIYTIALLGREYLKDLEDYNADVAGGRVTLPHRYGIRATSIIAASLTLTSIMWALVVFLMTSGHGGLRFIFFVLFALISFYYLYLGNISKAQGWLKPALLFHLLADLLYWS